MNGGDDYAWDRRGVAAFAAAAVLGLAALGLVLADLAREVQTSAPAQPATQPKDSPCAPPGNRP